MLLKKIAEELKKIKEINFNTMYNREQIQRFNQFVKHKEIERIFCLKLKTVREVARMLDVPVGFIIRILKLEEIDDYEVGGSKERTNA